MREFYSMCEEEYAKCKNNITSNLGEESATEECEKPLKTDPRYSGICPNTMQMLEQPSYDDVTWVLARAWLRTYFYRVNEDGFVETYRRKESDDRVRGILVNDPTNFSANSYLRFSFTDDEFIDPLRLELKLHDLDPDCPIYWFFRISEITDLVTELLAEYESKSLSRHQITDVEVEALIKEAWDTLATLYHTAYRSSKNVRKISYALQSIRHPFFDDESKIRELSASILGVEPSTYESERLRYFVKDLTSMYTADSPHGREQTLGMMCNDYAFEMTLAEHCLKLIDYYASVDIVNGVPIRDDVLQAGIILLSAASRDCNEYFWLRTEHWQYSVVSKVCLAAEYERYVEHLRTLFPDPTDDDKNAYRFVLKAFLDLDESIVGSYEIALRRQEDVLENGGRLAKRLQRRGFGNAATRVIELTIEAAQSVKANKPEEDIEYQRYIEVLERARGVLTEGRSLASTETPRFVIDYNN